MNAAPLLSALPDPGTEPEAYDGVPLRRGLAWIADMTLIFLISVAVLPFTLFTGLFYFAGLMLGVGFLYRWATLSGGSATWGMRLTGIALRERDGLPLRVGTAFLHTLGYSVSIAVFPLQLVSVVLMLTSPRGQGLSDAVLGTVALDRRYG